MPGSLIEPMTLMLPGRGGLEAAAWEGLRVLHLTDLHVRGPRPRHDRLIAELESLTATGVDLGLLTGDYMSHPGDEGEAMQVLRRVVETLRPRLGWYGVFGNHDTPAFAEACRERLSRVRWLVDDAIGSIGADATRYRLLAARGLRISGLHSLTTRQPDPVALLASRQAARAAHADDVDDGDKLHLLLSHHPRTLAAAAGLGIDCQFSGHTHGGQIRLPGAGSRLLVNSSPLPKPVSSGVLRYGRTRCCVSRGLGEMTLRLRVCCPPHAPLYTLVRRDVLDVEHEDGGWVRERGW